jgi:hypothetical protein
LGERSNRTAEVTGSIPVGSTILKDLRLHACTSQIRASRWGGAVDPMTEEELVEHLRRVEQVRNNHRPELIATLFVGESAPAGGRFFYFGNSGMTTFMKKAVENAFGPHDGDFLRRFQSFCWYLDDLVLIPVNNLKRRERRAACFAAQQSLADRIKRYQPQAIVTLLLGIKDIVEAAAEIADSSAERYAVPFPGMSHHLRFLEAMARIIKRLPRCS